MLGEYVHKVVSRVRPYLDTHFTAPLGSKGPGAAMGPWIDRKVQLI